MPVFVDDWLSCWGKFSNLFFEDFYFLLTIFLRNDAQNVVSAALRAVGNIVTGDDVQTQTVLNSGVLEPLKLLLTRPDVKEAIRKEACWTLSNITAGNRQQIQVISTWNLFSCQTIGSLDTKWVFFFFSFFFLFFSFFSLFCKPVCEALIIFFLQFVIDAGIIPILIDILANADFKTRKEAAWAITNALSGGTPEQIQYVAFACRFFAFLYKGASCRMFVQHNAVPPMCELLGSTDARILQVALTGLENILRVGHAKLDDQGLNPNALLIEHCYGDFAVFFGFVVFLPFFWVSATGLEKLEALQVHENPEIYQKALEIIEIYFGAEDEDADVLEDRADNNQYNFAVNPPANPQGGFSF
jgi:importin subunit alpha-6/7